MFEQLQAIHPILPPTVGLGLLVVAAIAADLIVKRLLLRLLRRFAQSGVISWGNVLVEFNVFGRLAQVVPALVMFSGINFLPLIPEPIVVLTKNVAMAYVALMLTLTLTAGLGAANQIYETYPISRTRPLKGFIQLLQIAVYFIGGIFIVAELIDRSPVLLLGGFGAMTAVLLIVFKDTILGLVASIQLTGNDMLRVGDWIEMPHLGADGDVIEVALHTVKVQNWDKTITTIPTHKLIAESFKNWRGMSESGGRRIKRTIFVDQSSIRFMDSGEVEKLKRFSVLSGYLDEKRRELHEYHAALGDAAKADVNRRRLTNVGTFRAYVFGYLKEHPKIHSEMTLLVRQLMPGPEGMPIEIYCFTRSTDWNVYEDVQADIFDHIIAILPEFGLRVFQKPTGADLAPLMRSL